MLNPILYHNPRCSKSRQALAFLQQSKIDVTVIEYLKTPLSASQLWEIYKALQKNNAIDSAINMIRVKEADFTVADINVSSPQETLIQAIADFPKLLERPILQIGDLAAIGRPTQNIESLVKKGMR